jgi:hypothetical protein
MGRVSLEHPSQEHPHVTVPLEEPHPPAYPAFKPAFIPRGEGQPRPGPSAVVACAEAHQFRLRVLPAANPNSCNIGCASCCTLPN